MSLLSLCACFKQHTQHSTYSDPYMLNVIASFYGPCIDRSDIETYTIHYTWFWFNTEEYSDFFECSIEMCFEHDEYWLAAGWIRILAESISYKDVLFPDI
jgi:hypothetical protein